MNKFGREKIALALACASIFGGKTQAMNNRNNNINRTGVESPQTLGAVRGATNQTKKINW